jgi:Putative MetA-pathway of phenol degradation
VANGANRCSCAPTARERNRVEIAVPSEFSMENRGLGWFAPAFLATVCLFLAASPGFSGDPLSIRPVEFTDLPEETPPNFLGEGGASISGANAPGGGRQTLFRWNIGSQQLPKAEKEDKVEPIATDRPDFTEASSTVGLGVFQIESGYTFIRSNQDGVALHTHSLGEFLFRYGVIEDWLELRLGLFPVTENLESTSSEHGIDDLYLGVKLFLSEQSGILPEMSIVPQLRLPTGSTHFSSERVLPGVNWLYGWDLNEFLSTAGSTQINLAVDDSERSYFEFAQAWTIGYTFTEQWGAYTEWFVLVPAAADGPRTELYFDGGFTYKFTPDVQWDIRGGVGLNEAAADFFAGVGLSLRFR